MSPDPKAELETEVIFCTRWAKNNYNLAQVIFGLSVLASFVSSILVGVGAKDWTAIGLNEFQGRVLLSAITALPAMFLLVNNTMRFEERAKWFWKKCRRLERMLRMVRYDPAVDVPTLMTEYSNMAEEMEQEWPAFGSTPTQPKKAGP
jgi:hypothetical protein